MEDDDWVDSTTAADELLTLVTKMDNDVKRSLVLDRVGKALGLPETSLDRLARMLNYNAEPTAEMLTMCDTPSCFWISSVKALPPMVTSRVKRLSFPRHRVAN